MNTCLNLINANIVLRVKNFISGFFDYTKILNLVDLKIFANLMLFALITSISSILIILLPTFSIVQT